MTTPTPSRRDFVASSGLALGGAWLTGAIPFLEPTAAWAAEAVRTGAPLETFTDREGADFEAFSARIIPTDDTPGAREAGAVHFADRALGSFMDYLMPIVRPGLADLDDGAQSGHGRPFSDLDEGSQDALVGQVEAENPGFFFFAKTLVMLGFG